MSIITVSAWNDYELLDSGNGRKLERFGDVILSRPAPQALWPESADAKLWGKAAGIYHRSNTGGGKWEFVKKLSEFWPIRWNDMSILVKPTGFGHLGVFPEQSVFWEWIYRKVQESNIEMNVLNLFAYTGYSTLSASKAGARVTHVDGAKSAVTWARENAERNGLHKRPIRWIPDDVSKFVSREARRGVKYDAVIMDPPTFGRGPKGEVWKIEQHLLPLLETFKQIMSDRFRFFLFTCHSQYISPPGINNLMKRLFSEYPCVASIQSGDIVIQSSQPDTSLPAGVYGCC
jgi:23S rRNA (cytosine1962-C5)-methyltransferase